MSEEIKSLVNQISGLIIQIEYKGANNTYLMYNIMGALQKLTELVNKPSEGSKEKEQK
jgi:hypothetical protein